MFSSCIFWLLCLYECFNLKLIYQKYNLYIIPFYHAWWNHHKQSWSNFFFLELYSKKQTHWFYVILYNFSLYFLFILFHFLLCFCFCKLKVHVLQMSRIADEFFKSKDLKEARKYTLPVCKQTVCKQIAMMRPKRCSQNLFYSWITV